MLPVKADSRRYPPVDKSLGPRWISAQVFASRLDAFSWCAADFSCGFYKVCRVPLSVLVRCRCWQRHSCWGDSKNCASPPTAAPLAILGEPSDQARADWTCTLYLYPLALPSYTKRGLMRPLVMKTIPRIVRSGEMHAHGRFMDREPWPQGQGPRRRHLTVC